MNPTAGHRIPPETIACIAANLDKVCNEIQGRPAYKVLGDLSLVCRYWAHICRPAMFKVLTLRSGNDLDSLILLLSSSTPIPQVPPMADCLECIQTVQKGPWKTPWVHRVPSIQRYTTHELDIRVQVQGVKDPVTDGLWNALIPRTLPPSLFLLRALDISDVRFRRVDDFLSTVRDLPNLEQLECWSISFGNESIPRRRAFRRRYQASQSVRGLEVSVNECKGPQMEKELMFTVTFEVCHRRCRFSNSRPWYAFRGLIMALNPPNLNFSSVKFDAVQSSLLFNDDNIGLLTLELDADSKVNHGASIAFELSQQAVDPISWDWEAFEGAILKLVPTPPVRLSTYSIAVFKTMLEAILGRKVLPLLNAFKRLDLRFMKDGKADITIDGILAQPAQYKIDDYRITLSPSERFDLMLCGDAGARMKYLRGILDAGRGVKLEDGDAARGDDVGEAKNSALGNFCLPIS